ncbi:DNA polymerase III subunit gamma/tau [Anaeromicropila populeti]|uniref:DNA-directed DNA polymerase n=1 Tax=Anaeromicropila populeti TaxID=37658 RepID=A0A1I6LSQ5_9FIRM|nr:DNA polymerase III subunit gamma/tau [Anaeromicropila populeti]SFS06439.1 DNA polymerase-3 subunit gamma/tau [Anaeromicropila populeti]
MSYTALYRKFRPGNFQDVRGQEHIVTTLRNQIKAERVGHAYLFCGTRGTGKTTIAKILAKAVNCQNPQDGSPCNECEMCKRISAQISMNVIEIDAASNNGVDNIREIVDEVQYSPTEGKYKVYIIDEVHMLSTGAFNALLKTLEEPPAYVIFILATTEVHKIPITILSRCQRYDFKRISIETITKQLMSLMDQEQVEVEEKAIWYIAKVADGSLRDALSLLDQCIAFNFGEKLTFDKALDVLGAVDIEVFHRLAGCILAADVVEAMTLVEEIVISGRELTQFVTDFTWYLRNVLLLKTSKEAYQMLDVATEQISILESYAEKFSMETAMRYIRIFSELSNQLKYASQKRVLLEIAIIKLCKPSMERDLSSVLERLRIVEEQLERGTFASDTTSSRQNTTDAGQEGNEQGDNSQRNAVQKLPKAISEDLKEVAKNWDGIVNNLSGQMRAMLRGVVPSVGSDNSLLLIFEEGINYKIISDEKKLFEIEEMIMKMIQKEVKLQTKLVEAREKSQDIIDLTKWVNMDIEYED